MQPAPAHHLGPMRMRLREPAWTNPLCRVASHALFCLVTPQRIGLGQTGGNYQKPSGCRAESVGKAGKSSRRSRPEGPVRCRNIRQGSCSLTTTPARHIHLADHGPKPPGSNHPLSRLAATQARSNSPTLGERTPPTGSQPLASQTYLAKECLGKGMIEIRACSIPLPHHSSAILLLTD